MENNLKQINMSSDGDITISGIPVFVERKRIKNMYIHIDRPNGDVRVSVPKNISECELEKFISSHKDWIIKNRTKIERTADLYGNGNYDAGETVYLWGRPYILEVHESPYLGRNIRTDEIAGRMIMLTENESTVSSRKALVDSFYKSELQRVLPEVLDKCATVVGRRPSEIRVRNMKTRWGTCNVREHRIWMNIQLAAHPRECLDYVMTHELTHLYVANHGPEFKSYMDRFYPDWRRVKKELNSAK